MQNKKFTWQIVEELKTVLHILEIKYQHFSMERKIRILGAARSSTPIILKTCSVHLFYLLLKLMVPALRIVLNESSEEVKTTVLISHPFTNTQANLTSR